MITKDMSIGEVVRKHPETAIAFRKHGMGCIGCIAARYESIEAGAEAHGIDVDALIKDINEIIRMSSENDEEKN